RTAGTYVEFVLMQRTAGMTLYREVNSGPTVLFCGAL
ncbi:hypothetical protein A2U01_0096358, partial [Trifolium medium]|nr:hypothetical protein [Trifolium medium]